MDMKEIGLHPENLFENIVEFDYRTTLLHIQEGLAEDEFTGTNW